LKEDIEPVEDEVWRVGRHCHVLNKQQPPFAFAASFATRKLQLARFLYEISETICKSQKIQFVLKKFSYFQPKLAIFLICLLKLRIKIIKVSSH
jgi:hypothetical protein